MQAAGADVLGALVDQRRDVGDRGDGVVGEAEVDALGRQQRDVLLEQRVRGLGEDADEVVARQRLELDADREAALELGDAGRTAC